MIRETFLKLAGSTGSRETLLLLWEELKEAIAEGENRQAVLSEFHGEYDIFYRLLTHEDPKVRKKTAQILGLLAEPVFLKPLWEAYLTEETRFVRSAYLEALQTIDYTEIFGALSEHYSELLKVPVTPENKKHLSEELRLLEELLHRVKQPEKHKFTGWNQESEVLLLTEPGQEACTQEAVLQRKLPFKTLQSGIMVKTKELRELFQIRTFREVLFLLPAARTLPEEEEKAAAAVLQGGLFEFLKARHTGTEPFFFRLEIRSRKEPEQRIRFAKRLAVEMEYQSGRKLLNSTSRYEFELRLVENREGGYNTMVKLMTLPDPRFSYRKYIVASSIRPNVAALVMQLASEYLTEGAQILDPFCGVGTMLIERNRLLRTGTMYGIDSFGEAIRGARENTKAAGLIANYINRDFFAFRHEYLFDELVTNLPFTARPAEEPAIRELYRKFFLKAAGHVKQQGILVLYTHNLKLIKANLGVNYRLERVCNISKKEDTWVCILRRLGEPGMESIKKNIRES